MVKKNKNNQVGIFIVLVIIIGVIITSFYLSKSQRSVSTKAAVNNSKTRMVPLATNITPDYSNKRALDLRDGYVVFSGSFGAKVNISQNTITISDSNLQKITRVISIRGDRINEKPYIVEVTAVNKAILLPKVGNYFGLVFDYLDYGRFYRFIINPLTGEWLIDKFIPSSNSYVELGKGTIKLQQYGLNNIYGFANVRMKVERNNEKINTYINDLLVKEISDSTYKNGKVGVIMRSPLIYDSMDEVSKQVSSLSSASGKIPNPSIVEFSNLTFYSAK